MGVCKTQIGCLIVVLYIAFIYIKECRRFQKEMRESFFDELLILAVICIFFDGASSYSVNHLEMVPSVMNSLIHMIFYISIDVLIFSLFLYVLFITGGITPDKRKRMLLCCPLVVNVLIMVFLLDP